MQPLDSPLNMQVLFAVCIRGHRTFKLLLAFKVLLYNIHFANLSTVIWRRWCYKISVEVITTFTSQLMSNQTTKMGQISIEINGNIYFSQFWHGENFLNFAQCFRCENVSTKGKNIWRNQYSSFLGGLSLHLNHLIAERMSAPYWQFGTLPIGIFLSNLVSGQLETSLMTSYCHFWNLSTFGDSRAVWVSWPKLGVFRKSKFSRWRSNGASMRLGDLGSQITRLYDGTIFGGVRHT